MRSKEEIEHAHDVLSFLTMDSDELFVKVKDDCVMREIRSVVQVLCWVLEHKDDHFEKNLLGIESLLFGKGIKIERTEDGLLLSRDDDELCRLMKEEPITPPPEEKP